MPDLPSQSVGSQSSSSHSDARFHAVQEDSAAASIPHVHGEYILPVPQSTTPSEDAPVPQSTALLEDAPIIALLSPGSSSATPPGSDGTVWSSCPAPLDHGTAPPHAPLVASLPATPLRLLDDDEYTFVAAAAPEAQRTSASESETDRAEDICFADKRRCDGESRFNHAADVDRGNSHVPLGFDHRGPADDTVAHSATLPAKLPLRPPKATASSPLHARDVTTPRARTTPLLSFGRSPKLLPADNGPSIGSSPSRLFEPPAASMSPLSSGLVTSPALRPAASDVPPLCDIIATDADVMSSDRERTSQQYDYTDDPEEVEEEQAQGGGAAKPFKLFGFVVHMSLVRAYSAPAEVDWSTRSFEMHYGLMYKDSVVADQFRAFYFRSFLSFAVGLPYSLSFLLGAVTPMLTANVYQRTWWISGFITLLLATMVDASVHLFAPVSPKVAIVRMIAAFVICGTPMLCLGWNMFDVVTSCEGMWQPPGLDDVVGRKTWTLDEQRRLCVQLFEPYQIAAVTLASSVHVYPVPHAFLTGLHFILCVFVGRQVASGPYADETYGEIAVEVALIVFAELAAVGITYVRFSAGRSAFEATIKVENHRRETADRAVELHQILHTIVPAAVLPRLEVGGPGQFRIDKVPSASMLFADMKGFTEWASSRSAEVVTSMLNTIVGELDMLAVETDTVEKVKTVGDAYWVVSGIPMEAHNHADQLVLFGWRMNSIIADLNEEHPVWGGILWRVGIHSGPMTGALFGERQISYEVFGETARIALKVESHGIPGAVVVTEQTVASLSERPPERQLRLHEYLGSVGPAGGALLLYEFREPRSAPIIDAEAPPNPAVAMAESTSGLISRLVPRATDASMAASISMISNIDGAAGPFDIVSRRTAPSSNKSNKSTSTVPLHARINAAASDALEKKRWRFLPYFDNSVTEALFKAAMESVCRPMFRVCSVFFLAGHLVHMLTLLALPEPCFHVIGVPLQFVAVVPFSVAIACAFHPRGSLRVSSGAMFTGGFIGATGTGLTALNGCPIGHDLQAYAFISFAALFFSVGPVSWPVITAAVGLTTLFPMVNFALFFSPWLVASYAIIPTSFTMMALVALTEEYLLRRRFVEEELSNRGQAQLLELNRQRVNLLQRLVPSHVVDDLIAWFGTDLDPDRSITRSYKRVVIAFLQLRPRRPEALPRLHAEVDMMLHDVCRGFRVDGSAIPDEEVSSASRRNSSKKCRDDSDASVSQSDDDSTLAGSLPCSARRPTLMSPDQFSNPQSQSQTAVRDNDTLGPLPILAPAPEDDDEGGFALPMAMGRRLSYEVSAPVFGDCLTEAQMEADVPRVSSRRARASTATVNISTGECEATAKYATRSDDSAPKKRSPDPSTVDVTKARVLDKIKTVGDMVMVAGPFTSADAAPAKGKKTVVGRGRLPDLSSSSVVSSQIPTRPASLHPSMLSRSVRSVRETSSVSSSVPTSVPTIPADVDADFGVYDEEVFATFNAVVELFARVRTKCRVRVGAHIGSVVGTVQGTSRLAFDIFGDPVNVASRVLGGSRVATARRRESAMYISADLAEFAAPAIAEEHERGFGRRVVLGPPLSLDAKGKGSLEIRHVAVP